MRGRLDGSGGQNRVREVCWVEANKALEGNCVRQGEAGRGAVGQGRRGGVLGVAGQRKS